MRQACLLLAFLGSAVPSFLFVQETPSPDSVVVNEIFYNPADSGERQEFIELLNRSDTSVDLRRYAFADANREAVSITDTSRMLPPGDYAVLVRDGAAFENAFPGVAFIEPSRWPALNNGGDTVLLYREGSVIDSVAYTSTWGGADGISLERIDPRAPSTSSNFGSSLAPNGATPGTQNSIHDPDEEPPAPIFAEQTAAAQADVYFNESVDAVSLVTEAFSLRETAPASLHPLDENERVRLTFDVPVKGGTLIIRGVRDLVGNTLDEAQIDLALQPTPDALVINEIMYDPLADDFDDRPNQPEYVELYNPTEHALSLHGALWTDQPDETGAADTLRFGTGLVHVAPGGYAVVYAQPSPDALAEAFPETNFSANDITPLGLDRHTLGLRNDGELIHLHRADGTPIDSVRYVPDWHAPELQDAKGIALERLDPEAPSNEAANWTSSVAEAGGTPGQPNSVALPSEIPDEETTGLEVNPSPFSPDGDGHEDVAAIRYRLGQAPASIRVQIFDSAGRLVRNLERARRVDRSGQLAWEGRDDEGNRLRMGIYVVLLEALDAQGGTVEQYKAPAVLARPLN